LPAVLLMNFDGNRAFFSDPHFVFNLHVKCSHFFSCAIHVCTALMQNVNTTNTKYEENLFNH
jgi:hypothetical protein